MILVFQLTSSVMILAIVLLPLFAAALFFLKNHLGERKKILNGLLIENSSCSEKLNVLLSSVGEKLPDRSCMDDIRYFANFLKEEKINDYEYSQGKKSASFSFLCSEDVFLHVIENEFFCRHCSHMRASESSEGILVHLDFVAGKKIQAP